MLIYLIVQKFDKSTRRVELQLGDTLECSSYEQLEQFLADTGFREYSSLDIFSQGQEIKHVNRAKSCRKRSHSNVSCVTDALFVRVFGLSK